MREILTRRGFVRSMGIATGAVAGVALAEAQSAEPAGGALKVLGICCSPRKGKTTSQALRICLEAAQAAGKERIETELIELADLEIPGYLAAGVPLRPGHKDDFPALAAKLTEPRVAGLIVGTPVYFGSMSSLCKAFLDRSIMLRKNFALANKVGGVVAVGGARNGGQELTLQGVLATLLSHEVIVVGDGRPTSHWGATVWNNGKDDISQDDFGVSTLKNLGRRVAEMVLHLADGR